MLAQEHGLFLRRELHHPEPILRVQAGEHAAVGAEVRMVHVRALGGAVEGQHDLAEVVGVIGGPQRRAAASTVVVGSAPSQVASAVGP